MNSTIVLYVSIFSVLAATISSCGVVIKQYPPFWLMVAVHTALVAAAAYGLRANYGPEFMARKYRVYMTILLVLNASFVLHAFASASVPTATLIVATFPFQIVLAIAFQTECAEYVATRAGVVVDERVGVKEK